MDVALLGTGTMGLAMGANLIKAGHTVRAWNRTAERAWPLRDAGAELAATPAEAVAGATVVWTMLYDLAATRQTIIEAGPAFEPGAVWVQSATIGRDGARALADVAHGLGVAMIDAPVLGTKKPAEDGTLTVLVSGRAELIERVRPALDAVSTKIILAGPELGDGSALKLATNAWVGTITAATAQSIALASGQGIDPQLFLDALADAPVGSPYAQLKGQSMIAGHYPPSFPLDGVIKDLDLMVAAAEATGMDTTVLRAVHQTYRAGQAAGWGEADLAAVYEAIRPPR